MQARTYIVTAALLLAGAAPASAQSQWPSYQYPPPPPATYYVPYRIRICRLPRFCLSLRPDDAAELELRPVHQRAGSLPAAGSGR